MRRLSGLASRAGVGSSLRRTSALKALSLMSQSWDKATLTRFEMPLVTAVYRVLEGAPVPGKYTVLVGVIRLPLTELVLILICIR